MKNQVSSFILKTYNILENHLYDDIVSWTEDGLSFLVKNISQFSSIVLPIHFKHQNFSSFIRQLNMYDFHKTKGGTNNEFKNENFQRGRKDLLPFIKRKTHNDIIQIIKTDEIDNSEKINQLSSNCDYLHKICNTLLEHNHKVLKDNKLLQKALQNVNKGIEEPNLLQLTNSETINNIQ